MRVLIAIGGAEPAEFFAEAVALAPLAQAEDVILAHVIDARPRADLEHGRERFFTRHSLPAGRSADLTQAEEERARAGLRFAHEALVQAGVPEDRLQEVLLRGDPRELQRLAEDHAIDLVIVGGRGGKPGPHSIGKTARFLIDHAPHAALLVR